MGERGAPQHLCPDDARSSCPGHCLVGGNRARRPQSNGFVERLHRTLLDEHFRIKGREKWYESVAEMHKELETYLHTYNHSRTHQGRNMNGRTPHQAFMDGLPKKEQAKKAADKAA